jgi:hydrogenase maturation factor
MASERPAHCHPAPDGTCSICSDEAVVGLVNRVDSAARTAEVLYEHSTEIVALDLVSDVVKGDTVLVHMGFAISRMRPGD